ncbi:glycine--tRNA ligase subunit beta [Oceanobacillus halophilus]|uniref:Glycine--tRNA ligase beta subunit n=1 Tax=Oceanobacillus halophilus TaxID=930130 RepID=A0A495ACX3_9BACI|nr:glycine--tRNA ligase subunit beta [Oceanobacillus halophilus]RKQ37817.1 glycine--tRNA ligase subunit beta [Oceanobacillus halophilus]
MAKNVLFEVGLEELPARFVDDAEKQLLEKTITWLNETRISFEDVTTFSTPRRLSVLIRGMADVQETIEEEAKGPAEKIAIDENGNWTKAAIGFTKGQGMSVEDIYTKEIKGTRYIFVKKRIEGKKSSELLPGFKEIIESIQFGKNMRWSTETMRYARPIRWLLALYDKEVVPFEIASVSTSNKTYGHRFLGNEVIINDPLEYRAALRNEYVIVDSKEREQMILEQIKDLEEKENLLIPVDEDLLDEVRNLVEFPTVFIGSFEKKFLKLPSEVLITSMKEHQRYFPAMSTNEELLPKFVGVRNGDNKSIENVAKGNEKVLRARLSDAEFFYEEDQKNSIDFYLEKLQRVVFQEKLGTYADKVSRVVTITNHLCKMLDVEEKVAKNAIRAAEISKFDLMTNMVNEFTELQGIIGEKYAILFGENQDVAKTIREHYLPKQANGDLPDSIPGSIVSIADKVDTIVGCISIGLVPTGSQDPYGLRRQATGILRILSDKKWSISLESILNIVKSVYANTDIQLQDNATITKALNEFFQLRTTFLLKEDDIETDIIHSVTAKEIGVFDYTEKKAALLSQKRNEPAFKPIQEALVRVLNLAGKTDEMKINSTLFETESEKILYSTFQEIVPDYEKANKELDADLSLSILSKLAEPIHNFFDNTMVMANDEKIKNNRLALLNTIAASIKEFADLSLIEWKQHQ